ncbi:ketopantoate reductase family protein [Candidatus Viridilinea mediisalina]|uniref:2-dehydropantoate 2-reductase n=1 Tax=Candidatus Viridilinea mediisalina TaxID=2024553 RepID=A0A2A6RDK3_9CHLR|nr:2-dehydropantoate 2-reductase [Candidatus Viridilinea mediisalina]PDV99547.1 2-dehydropantoate 2-reductase [Candidatus Viridilinea mediisalina]
MRIAILGAGALGGLIGFYLARVADVVLVDTWEAHVAAIKAHGLICEYAGQTEARSVCAVSEPHHVAPVPIALVLVKAHQTAWAARVAAQLLTPDGVAYTLQNGLGNYDMLAASLGAARVGQGVTTLGATLLGPGRVRLAGLGPTTLGSVPEAQRAAALAEQFSASGLATSVSTEIEGLIWGKLLVNVGINALTALLRVPNGALATSPEARQLLEAVVCEAAAVAAAKGLTLPYADPVAHTLAVAQATASNQSSMLQDILRGSPSEINTINGAIVREGERLGLPTPLNAMLTKLVLALEAL